MSRTATKLREEQLSLRSQAQEGRARSRPPRPPRPRPATVSPSLTSRSSSIPGFAPNTVSHGLDPASARTELRPEFAQLVTRVRWSALVHLPARDLHPIGER